MIGTPGENTKSHYGKGTTENIISLNTTHMSNQIELSNIILIVIDECDNALVTGIIPKPVEYVKLNENLIESDNHHLQDNMHYMFLQDYNARFALL